MEFIFNVESAVALGTLVLLEVVLGIDNLVFIAILSEKLPREKRARARLIGLGLALFMRLGLLSAISWIVTLTAPFISLFGHTFSGRDLILLSGGLFLLFKATTELHERLEGVSHAAHGREEYAGFWLVIAQIVVLDAVFSLDAIITAVGMTQSLPIMMTAVVLAMGIMVMAATPLTGFVNTHPTVIVLCLSFLLLIGLSLIAEGFGAHLPKGYLYAAIGFSVIIEFFNQIARRNVLKHEKRRPMRLRTAEAVARLLEGKPPESPDALIKSSHNQETSGGDTNGEDASVAEEINMISRVLSLSGRTARSVMTHRADAAFLNLEDSLEKQREILLRGTPSVLPVCRGSLDDVLGVAHAAELLGDLVRYGQIRESTMEEPRVAPESMPVLNLLDMLRSSRSHLVLVADEFGSIEGLVTHMDLFEAIAGEVVEEGEQPDVRELGDGRWSIRGTANVNFLENFLDLRDIVSDGNDYTSLAGFMLAHLGRIPEAGDSLEHKEFRYTVQEVDGRRISRILVEKL